MGLEEGGKWAHRGGTAGAYRRIAQRRRHWWPHYGLHDDAEAIRQEIKQIDGPAVVVAHSYGGVAAS
jgi:predicted alpha/beta hydrolase family esterase